MLMGAIKPLLLLLIIFISLRSTAQDSSGVLSTHTSAKYLQAISDKTNQLGKKLDKKSQKAIARFQQTEEKIQKKLSKIDSIAAKNIFTQSKEKYQQLTDKLKDTSNLTQYIPKLDTLASSLKFFAQNPQWLEQIKDGKNKLSEASEKLKEFQSQLQQAENVKQFLKERRQYLRDQLMKFGFAKELKNVDKEVYYYSQQINEYKEIFKDPKKVEKKAIELLSKTKLFKDFMKKNSMLASLFNIPGDPNDPLTQVNLAGLQTRAQVNLLIQTQIASGGPNAQQIVQQNIQQAQSQLQNLKNKVFKAGGGSSDAELPDFKPNNQKTKSFLERIEIGTNMQSQKGNGLLPVTSDVGLSIGYKLNDKSMIGIGGSYKVGWGNGWNNIRISSQGASVRSFVDWKIKGSFYLSGGFEMNYRQELNGVVIPARSGIYNAQKWQQSGLIGLSKVVSVKSKFFKKTKVQVLWDYLSYEQVPRGQAVIFRIGYTIK
jgi:hypothetical protein